jgi:hypothetical protein
MKPQWLVRLLKHLEFRVINFVLVPQPQPARIWRKPDPRKLPKNIRSRRNIKVVGR